MRQQVEAGTVEKEITKKSEWGSVLRKGRWKYTVRNGKAKKK